MELITWTDELNTGFDKIDAQHRHLAKLINEFYSHVMNPPSADYVKNLILELYGYTVNHFSQEEELMLQTGYSGFYDHKREHNRFISKLDALRDAYFRNENDTDTELLLFLKAWFISHIMGVDKKTFETIR